MKLKIAIIALLFSCASMVSKAQVSLEKAHLIMEKASTQAKKEHKNVFLIFHASWCGWCKALDNKLNDPLTKAYFDKNYVFTHLTVLEKDSTMNHPGALELMAKLGGKDAGLPFWVVLDPKGKIISTSLIVNNQNVGSPTEAAEVSAFIDVLKKSSKLDAKTEVLVKKVFLEKEL